MSSREPEIGLFLAPALMVLNLILGFVLAIFSPPIQASTIAGGMAFLEFGFLLIIGSCLMARQPLENKDRYAEDGSTTHAWRMALIGKHMLIAALILFLFAALMALVGIASLF